MRCRRTAGLLLLALLTTTGLLVGLLWPLAGRALSPASLAASPTPPDRPPPPPLLQRDYPLPPPARPRPADVPLPPDLSILTIGRTPRYPRYCLDYTHDVPMLCPGTETAPRFPAEGEIVTLHARVANQGEQPTTSVPFTWTLDGAVQQTGLLPGLDAGAEYTLTWTWAWQSGPHTITLALGVLEDELTPANNRLDHRTDAHYLEVLVHPYFVEAFRRYRNLVGSYSFADWLQAQFAQMNQRLAAAVYPETPHGVPDRIRIDVITTTVAVGGDQVVGHLDFDGRWTFRPERDYRDTPQNEAWESAERYARTFAAGIDWGLIHELAHQLGLIDLYQLNVSPSDGNRVHDGQGLPLLAGFYWARPDLMGGDDVAPYDATHFGPHAAMALVRNTGYRRGYFGEYLYDLPTVIRVQVLDRRDRPVPAATVSAYQTERNVVGRDPVFTGLTDATGVFTLPNRPVSPTLTTATAHTLRPNPFGRIDVVGRNGQMLLRVALDDQEFFVWLPLTELNKLAWRGRDAVTLTLRTHFPGESTLPPPDGLEVHTAGEQVVLHWSPVAGAVGYNLYAGVWPGYYPFRLLRAGITETTVTAVITTSTRFAVTSIAPEGSESGFSAIGRAELLHAPRGLVWEPTSPYATRGRLLVVDAHTGGLVALLPPEAGRPPRWLGRVGSEHIGLVGATTATLGPQGETGVVLMGAQRVWVLDPEQRVLNWFGRVDERPGPLAQPAGLALTGAAFTVARPLRRPDTAAFLVLPFDGSLADPAGIAPLRAEGLALVPGRFGEAVRVDEGGLLHYRAPAATLLTSGSVEFWLQPGWAGTDKGEHVLLEIGDPTRPPYATTPGYRLRIAHEAGGLYVWVTDFEDLDKAAWANVEGWQPGEWHHVAATWDAQRLNLYLDGRLAWAEALRVPIRGQAQVIAIGSTLHGESAAEAAFDDLRVSEFPRLGNSDAVRLIISEANRRELRVFDLLGNLVSVYTPPGGLLVAPGPLAVAPDGTLWLLDAGTQALHQLRLTDDGLIRLRTVPPFTTRPLQALIVHPLGLPVVAAGDAVYLLDPDLPWPVVRTWLVNRDGEPLRRPVALAVGPDGSLAVAEADTRRISFLPGVPTRPQRLWLPLLRR